MQMGVEQEESLSEGNETKISVSDDDQSTLATMAAVRSVTVPYIYRQDIVRSMKRGMFGIATEVPGDSDSDSSVTDEEDEEEDDHDDEEEVEDDGDNEDGNYDDKNKSNNESDRSVSGNCKRGPLSDHQVRVLWMDETESIENMNDVEVIDRGFLHGDYVAAASDPTGQLGVVVDVNITCDLMAPSEAIVKGISSKDLKRVRDFNVGDYVVLGTWLGRVDDVVDNVTVLFDDGSVCKVTKADPMHLKPISKNLIEDGHFTYYPGQRVKGSSSSVFKYSSWLSGLWKPNRLEGTVTKVTVGSVFVYWIASAGYGPDSSTAPAEEQSPKNLKLLSCFAHASWQLGDWCLLPASVRSSAISLDMGLSKLELHDSVNCELDPSQLGSEFDSEEVALEELNGKEDVMNVDPADGSEGNGKEKKASHESGSSGSSQSVSRDPIRDTWPLHRKKIRKVVIRRDKKVRKKVENFEKALMIVNTRTTVDVAWQDGTMEHGAEGTKLIPIDNPGDHEFVAEQYVVEKTTGDDEMSCESRRVGVVKSVNAKDRTANVRWLKQVSRAEDPREFEKEEVVSVYELQSHPDYYYCYGDVVVRLCPVSLSSQTVPERDSDHTKMPSGLGGVKQESDNADDESGNDACMDFSELSWVGNITGLKNGDIEVTWADGMVSTVGPQAIYVVGRDDDDGDSVPAGSEISDAVSWETVNDDERNVLEDSKEEIRLSDSKIKVPDAEDDMASNYGKNAALSMPLAAIRFVTRLASGIFSRGQKNFDPLCLHSQGKYDIQSDGLETSEGKATSEEYHSSTSSILDTGDKQQYDRKIKDHGAAEVSEVGEAAEILCNLKTEEGNGSACGEDETCNFKRFDIAKDPLDHYFIGADAQNNNSRRWLKKVQQDWSILHNNLPEGVYVRVYEDRMDLLRAVIVGAYGTPYQDGLFFFDFHLPPEYPDAPPSAYYHSGGWRINPNLYEEGKVCLSLLNTWTGRGNEVWDPKSSSILQVLVSLQGLVLNSKPYFNEAGYDKQIGTAEGEKNSLSYNENAYLLNCKTMMYLMRKPPKEFETLIKEHFKRRGYYILKACDAYMKGYLIGSLTKDASVSSCKGDQDSNSVGFRLMLGKLMPKLFLALSDVGADCHEFQHLQQS